MAAVVVTHNRPDKLPRVLDALLAQSHRPDRILVVDNASEPATARVLEAYQDEPSVRVHRMSRNTGGAGGFAEGLRLALAEGWDQLWLMDDDCYAGPESLARLLAGREQAEQALDEPVVFAGSLVAFPDGELCMMNSSRASDDWAALLVRGVGATLVDRCSFVSVLIPAWAVRAAGLPLTEYFIWFDDAEYTSRLRGLGRGIQVHDSVVTHDMGVNRAVNVAQVEATSLWKFRYGVRNESSWLWHHRGVLPWAEFVLLTVVRMRRGRVPWRLRWRLYRAVLAGLAFDPDVTYPDEETSPGR